MDAQVFVWEKQGREWWRKTQRITLNTLDKKLPFWLEIFAHKFVEKNLWKGLEKLAQSPLEILVKNNAQTPKFIGSEKLAVGVLSDLSVDRQRSRIRPLEPSVDRPVDRKEQRALLLVTVDWVGRPAICQVKACTSVHVGRPSRSTDFSPSRLGRSTSRLGRSTSRLAWSLQQKIWDKNLVFLIEIKSHKYLENLQK